MEHPSGYMNEQQQCTPLPVLDGDEKKELRWSLGARINE
jgi:hypothetical protein